MIRRTMLLWLSVGCLIVLPLRNIYADEGRNNIEGTWMLVAAELGGKKLPDASLQGSRLVLSAGRYAYQIDQGTYKLLPVENPNAMDINGTNGPNKGKTFLAIYELSGDTLRICYDLEGKARPTEFKTEAGTKQFLASYKRAKEL